MKTNKILVALALPALFAACTAEEIVNQADNNVLENRALLGDLVVNMETPVASRASWSEKDLAWGAWEDDDAFTSALVDAGATPAWDNVANTLFTNYVWTKGTSGWGTTSQMVEGIYSFYSYKGIATKNDRKPVAFDLTSQTTDLDNPTQVIDDHQLFFSPLYMIEAKNTTAENTLPLDLKFYPYHSIAAFKMVNATGQTLLISQIIANGEFAAKGAIMPSKIKAAGLQWFVRKGEKVYKLAAKEWENATNHVAKTEYTAKEEKAMWQESDLDNIGGEGELSLSGTLAMNCNNWEWADGEEVMAYMVMPANAEIDNIEINVVDEEGEAKYVRVEDQASNIEYTDGAWVKSIASTGIEDVEFKRSIPVSVFGYTSAGAPKSVTVKAANLADAKGYYIDNKEDLEKLVNISRGNIKVYNFGDLAVDAEVAEIIAEYTGGIVTFTNPIEVKDTEVVTISNIKFGEVTVKGEDTTTGFEGTTVVFEDAEATKLTIEAGATATIEAGTYAEIINNGTLSVEAAVEDAEITSTSVLNVYNGENDITLKQGSLNFLGNDADEDGTVEASEVYEAGLPTIDAAGNITITYAEKVNLLVENAWSLTPAADKTAALTVNGGFELNAALTVSKNATLTAAKDIEGNGSVLVNGTMTNGAEATVAISIAENATLNNNGIANNITLNNGNIVTGANSKTAVASGTTGRIDNTNEAQVTANSNQVVFYTVNNKAVEDLEGILFKRYAVNTLRVTGTLTMDRPFGEKAVPEQLAVLKNLELAAGAEVKVDGDVHTMFEKVTVEGNAKIYGWSKAESSLTFDKNVEVILTQKRIKTADKTSSSKGYVLTISDVTVGGTCTNDADNHVKGSGIITLKSDRFDNDAKTDYEFLKPELKIVDAEMKNGKFGDANVKVDGIEVPTNATIIATAKELKDAFNKGGTVVLTENVVLDGSKGNYFTTSKNVNVIAPAGTTIEIEGFGFTGELNVQSAFNQGTVVFEGVTFNVPSLTSGWAMSSNISGTAKVTFRNCEFIGVQCPIYQFGAEAVVTLEKCKFNTTGVAIQAEIYSGDFQLGQDLIIKNCDFGNMADVLHIYDHDKNPSSAQIKSYLEANGNTFKGTCKQTCN